MKQYHLENKNGVEVRFLPLGGKLTSILIPSGEKKTDILIGYDSVQEYLDGDIYFGPLIGRYANRIGKGEIVLDGEVIQLCKNQGENHIHGGDKGFFAREWKVESVELEGYTAVYKLSLLSVDGEEGYPGNLKVEVLYALNERNELLIDLQAQTDKTTVVNLTAHPYFNLNGVGDETVLNHELQVRADYFTPLAEISVTNDGT